MELMLVHNLPRGGLRCSDGTHGAVHGRRAIMSGNMVIEGRASFMDEQFILVADETTLGELVERSQNEPVVLFKHDPVCSISIMAYYEMKQLNEPIPMIDVKRAGPVSQTIARQTGVKHESPQVIVLRNRQAVWSASHHAITAEAVERAVSEHM